MVDLARMLQLNRSAMAVYYIDEYRHSLHPVAFLPFINTVFVYCNNVKMFSYIS